PSVNHLLHHPFPTRRSSDLEIIHELRGILRRRTIGDVHAATRDCAADIAEVAEPFLADGMDVHGDALTLETSDRRARLFDQIRVDRKSTRLNSSHDQTSYAV